MRAHENLLLCACLAAVSCLCGVVNLGGQEPELPDFWATFRFMTGEWQGDAAGASGAGRGSRTCRFILENRFLHCRSELRLVPPEQTRGAEHRLEWSFLSYDLHRRKFILREFNNEGFVNQYVLESVIGGSHFLFVSENIENALPGFRARITLAIESEAEFSEKLELARPSQEFREIRSVRWKRKS